MSATYSQVDDILPLSPLQEALLLHAIERPTDDAYSERLAVHFTKKVDVEFMRTALQGLVARHEGLRARYQWERVGIPVQIIGTASQMLTINAVELGDLDEERLRGAKESWLREDQARRWDLRKNPLRFGLILSTQRSVLLASWHHILLDGWSMAICLNELLDDYRALEAGQPLPKRAQTSPKQLLRGRRNKRLDRENWEIHLRDAKPTQILGLTTGDASAKRHIRVLPEAFRIAAFCAAEKVTPAALYHAAWGLLAQRWSYSRDVLFGTVLSGRDERIPGALGAVGMFINTLPVRLAAGPDATAAEVVRIMHTQMRALHAHGDISLAELGAMVNAGTRGAIFDSLLVVENYPLTPDVLPGGSALVDAIHLDEQTEMPVTATVLEQAEGVRLEVTVRAPEGEALARRLCRHWEHLLLQMIGNPVRRIAELTNMPDGEISAILGTQQTTAPKQPREGDVLDAVLSRAEAHPDRIALVDDRERLSYGDMVERIDQIARALRLRGVKQGDLVGVLTRQSIDTVITLMAVVRAGAAYVPISRDYPAGRIAEIIEDCSPRLVIASDENPIVTKCERVHFSELLTTPANQNELPERRPEDRAYVIYSSGSTGKPKGIAIPLAALPRLILDQSPIRIKEGETVLLTSAFEFDVSVFEMWSTLANGGRLVVVCRDDLLDADALHRWVVRESVSQAWLITSLFNAHIASGANFFGMLKRVIIGGEALSAEHVRRAMGRFPNLQIINGYGPTENTILTTIMPLSAPVAQPVPIGRAVSGTSLQVLDLDRHVLPPGALGELATGGEGVALGYLNRPPLNRDRFVEDPFLPGRKRFLTGDMVRAREDGVFDFFGRRDAQVKIRGHRLDISEIEQRMLEHGGVREAAVVLCNVEETETLIAFVLASQECDINAMTAKLKSVLPPWAMPARIDRLEAFPMLSSGKLDRAKLSAMARYRLQSSLAQPAKLPNAGAPDMQVAPTPLHSEVAAIWTTVLGKEIPSKDTPFLEAGGTSLHIIRLKSLIAQRLGIQVSVADLFAHTTIADQAAFLQDSEAKPRAKETSAPAARITAPANGIKDSAIAIVGMAGRFPNAPSVEELWHLIVEGREGLHRFSDKELLAHGVSLHDIDENLIPVKGLIADVDRFDAAFFGYSPRQGEMMDPQVRLLHQVCWDALEHSACDPWSGKARIGLYAGILPNPNWLAAVRSKISGEAELYEAANLSVHAPTSLISHALKLTGPSILVDTACSTSAVAIHLACQGLKSFDCDVALAGAASVEMPVHRGYRRVDGMIHSHDGHCRPFDAGATGTVSGDGVAIVVLKRLEQARADGDRILAVIRGTAVNNDGGRKVGYTAPSVNGQVEVIETCLHRARFEPHSIGLVEAHGTATSLGDPIEAAALARVFKAGKPTRCSIGSIKGNIGHLNSTAGVAGVIKAVLALHRRVQPPAANFIRLNPEISADDFPFELLTRAQSWSEAPDRPRRAVVSSFGIGGSNAHIALEEAPAPPEVPAEQTHRVRILPFSAATAAALRQRVVQTMSRVAHDRIAAQDLETTLRNGRTALRHRMVAFSDASKHDLSLEDIWRSPCITGVTGAQTPFIAMMFPGQGTQRLGMARGLYAALPRFAGIVDDLLARLAPHADFDPIELFHARTGAERLVDTWIAQPMLFVVELALALQLEEIGLRATAMIGHSLGEYTAATMAGVFTTDDALRIVALRGRLMQQMPRGAMIAIAATQQEADTLLQNRPDLNLAAVNASNSCVLSGSEEACARLLGDCPAIAATATRLQTSHAFHSAMMDGMLESFARALEGTPLSAPSRPLISNVTGSWMTLRDATDPAYWCRHSRQPVLFAKGVSVLLGGVQYALEVGPGHVLSSLARRNTGQEGCGALLPLIPDTADAASEWPNLRRALARVWCDGAPLEWSRLDDGCKGRRVTLPGHSFAADRHWDIGREIEREPAADQWRAAELDWGREPGWWPIEGEPDQRQSPLSHPLVVTLDEDSQDAAEALTGELRKADIEVNPILAAQAFDHIAGLAHNAGCDLFIVADCQNGPLDPASDAAGKLGLLLPIVRSAAASAAVRSLTLVTCGGFRVLIDDLTHPTLRSLSGALVHATTEMRAFRVTVLDTSARAMPGAATLAQAVAQGQSGRCMLLAHRLGKCFTRTYDTASPVQQPAGFDISGRRLVWLIGGTGGIGSAIAAEMLQHKNVHVAVSARHRINHRLRGVLDAAARTTGTSWSECPLDAATSDMHEALSLLRRDHGDPDTIIFAAGNPGKVLLDDLDEAALKREMSVKTRGTVAMLEALKRADILHRCRAILFCSSVAAEFAGAPGQIAYGASNAWLDGLAEYCRRQFGIFALSIGWDTWRERGMAARLVNSAWVTEQDVSFSSLFQSGQSLLPKNEERSLVSRTVSLRKGRDWIVDEHTFGEVGIMPATGFLVLAAEQLRNLLPQRESARVTISEATLLAPLRLGSDEGCVLDMETEIQDDFIRFSIKSRSDLFDAQPTTHVRGTARQTTAEPPADEPLVVCLEDVDIEKLARGSLRYGAHWNCLRSLRTTADRTAVEAFLALPQQFASEAEGALIHPALFDIAIGLLDRVSGKALEMVPFSFTDLTLSGQIGATATVRITRQEEQTGVSSLALAIEGANGQRLTCGRFIKRPLAGLNTASASLSTDRPLRKLPVSGSYALAQRNSGDLGSLTFSPAERVAPGPGEVEIEVFATGLNFKEVLYALNQLPPSAAPLPFGMECAGRISRIGPDIRGREIGEPVIAACRGAFQRFVVLPAETAIRKPRASSYAAAAALPTAYLTAHAALVRLARLREDETILVHSAASGVGLAALHLARHLGARVLATAGSDEKRERLSALGVECVGSSRDELFVVAVKSATYGRGVDVVLNSLPGKLLLAGFDCLAPAGRFVELGVRDIAEERPLPMSLFAQGRMFLPIGEALPPREISEALGWITRMIDKGDLPELDHMIFGAPQIDDAFRLMAGARHFGKIVIAHRKADEMARLDAMAHERMNGAFATGFSDNEALRVLKRWTQVPIAQSHIIVSPRPLQALAANKETSASTAVHRTADSAPLRPRPNLPVAYRAARTRLETECASMLEQHLGVAPVGIDDNFFELGATSLDIVQLAAKLASKHPAVKVLDFYEAPSVANLAARIAPDDAAIAETQVSAQNVSPQSAVKQARKRALDTARSCQSKNKGAVHDTY